MVGTGLDPWNSTAAVENSSSSRTQCQLLRTSVRFFGVNYYHRIFIIKNFWCYWKNISDNLHAKEFNITPDKKTHQNLHCAALAVGPNRSWDGRSEWPQVTNKWQIMMMVQPNSWRYFFGRNNNKFYCCYSTISSFSSTLRFLKIYSLYNCQHDWLD